MSAEVVAHATSAGDELHLLQRDDGSLELRVNGVFVMDTMETSTERALAARALALHPAPGAVLVGGLGLGFTLGAVLDDERVETVEVVELHQPLIDWLTRGDVPHGPGLLASPRATVRNADIGRFLAEAGPSSYDLVLLDVDNGPGYLVHDANAGLYEPAALGQARRVTRPGGTVVVWSAAEAPELATAMAAVFGDGLTEAVAYDVDLQGRAETYWLYVGGRPGTGES